MHSVSGGVDLFDQILLAAVSSAILLGGVLFWMLQADRRKVSRQLRLKAIAGERSSPDVLVASLRRPLSRQTALPAALMTWLERACAATGNRIGLLHLMGAGVIAAVAVTVVAALAQLHSVLAIAFVSAAAVGTPALLLRSVQSRYQRQFLDLFPDALDLIVRAVRAGLPAPEAIEMVTHEIRPPVGTEFKRMLDEVRIGMEMEDALQRAAARIRVPDFQFFVVSLALQRQTGGGIAEILSNLSSIIRQRKALRQKARALAAEAQASAAIVATAPFVAGGGLFLINRQLMSVLLVDPRGRFMLGLAAVGLLLGIVAMKALINRKLS
jgi:tight adherence protein B